MRRAATFLRGNGLHLSTIADRYADDCKMTGVAGRFAAIGEDAPPSFPCADQYERFHAPDR